MDKKARRLQLLQEAKGIVDAVKASGRGFAEGERTTIEAKMAEADQLQKAIDQEAKDADLLARLGGGGTSTPVTSLAEYRERNPFEDAGGAKSMLLAGLERKSPVAVRLTPAELKASAGLSTGDVGTPGLVPFDGGITVAPKPLAVTDLTTLFTQQTVDAGAVRAYELGDFTGIAEVLEGAPKPEITGTMEARDIPLVKLAGYFKTSLEFQQDAPHLLENILRQAQLDLVRARNVHMLSVLGSANGVEVVGTTPGNQLDALADAVGNMEARTGQTPTMLIAAPSDLVALRKLKNGNGAYLIDPFSTHSAGPFNLAVASVPGMMPGAMYVAAAGAATWYAHTSGVMVQNGFADDDLVVNKTTTVFEQRGVGVVNAPHLLTRVSMSQ